MAAPLALVSRSRADPGGPAGFVSKIPKFARIFPGELPLTSICSAEFASILKRSRWISRKDDNVTALIMKLKATLGSSQQLEPQIEQRMDRLAQDLSAPVRARKTPFQ